jgi:NADH dehydrogenase [ubiquinone] 1 alpha subcomplex assembly factor 2
MRRIVKHSKGRHVSYSDVKLSPQWHQWLRHTRDEPPTLLEQQAEVQRQERMKQLAAEADERWRSVPSFMDKPRTAAAPQLEEKVEESVQQPEPALQSQAAAQSVAPPKVPGLEEGTRTDGISATGGEEVAREKKQDGFSFKPKKAKKENPWEKALPKGNAGENWQPEGWTPGVARRGG